MKTKNLSLLLAEDYEPLRHELSEILTDYFLTVQCASNGKEALERYEAYHQMHHQYFDLVISDIQMPVMNGVELTEALLQTNEEQKIIILSAHTDSEYLLDLINLGIAQFIKKPVDDALLFEVLDHVTQKMARTEKNSESSMILHLSENYTWEKERQVLTKDDMTVELSRHELFLLQSLIDKREQICTNDEILSVFYTNGIDLDEKNIRNLVYKLRKKLPEKMIISCYGLGYKMILNSTIDKKHTN